MFTSLPYWRMEPHNELAVGGPCLAQLGQAYACYVEGADLTLENLLALDAPEKAQAKWVDTWTGKREPVKLNRAQVYRQLRKPESFGKAPALLVVR